MNTITMNSIMDKIEETTYSILPNSTVTTCVIKMKSGFMVIGKSACVDPDKFNVALGEKYAYEDAFNQIWPLEGYLLASKLTNTI